LWGIYFFDFSAHLTIKKKTDFDYILTRVRKNGLNQVKLNFSNLKHKGKIIKNTKFKENLSNSRNNLVFKIKKESLGNNCAPKFSNQGEI